MHAIRVAMPRIGSVPYLNARPLLEGLGKVTGEKIFLDHPAGLHEAILRGQLQVALLPVVSYLENRELKIIPGTGIACDGEVKSVKVFHNKSKVDLSNTECIFLDPLSKTSQRLLKVLLVKKYDRNLDEIQWATRPEHADSVLQIGDEALKNSHFGNSQDLGLEWKELTGLPFVFACWLTSSPITQDLLTHLHNAKMLGLQKLDEIAQSQEIIDPEDALVYLRDHIKYHIAGPDLVGLKLFFDWVGELENQDYDTSLRFVA
jgi:chorismate dehydratase